MKYNSQMGLKWWTRSRATKYSASLSRDVPIFRWKRSDSVRTWCALRAKRIVISHSDFHIFTFSIFIHQRTRTFSIIPWSINRLPFTSSPPPLRPGPRLCRSLPYHHFPIKWMRDNRSHFVRQANFRSILFTVLRLLQSLLHSLVSPTSLYLSRSLALALSRANARIIYRLNRFVCDIRARCQRANTTKRERDDTCDYDAEIYVRNEGWNIIAQASLRPKSTTARRPSIVFVRTYLLWH